MIAAAVVMALLPRVAIVDDAGRTRSTAEWNGAPAIVVPMYTRCPAGCPMIVESLKRAVQQSKSDPTSYRVILFSFDPRDTPSDLRHFREHHRLPLIWTLATADASDVRRVMEALEVPTAAADGVLIHPNVAVALTPDGRVVKRLYGTNLGAGDLDAALSVARGGKDWLGRYGPPALALLLFLCVISAIGVRHQLSRVY